MTADRQDDSRNPEERLLALFLEAHPEAEAVAFETWVASRAELRDDAQLVHRLRALFAQWHRAAELLGDGLSSRRSNLGSFFRAAGKDRGANDERAKSAGLQVGQRVGHFTLRSFIAQGGMGQVWQAHDEDLRTDVALKLILPGRIDAHSLDLFAREARAGGRLRHPYIVTTLSTGRADGLTWIAQELVDGSWTLKDYLDQLRTEDTVPKDHYKSVALFVARVADGLQAAHDAGVIHRDVKPANILIAPDDTPRLTDFGLARVVDDSFLSQSGDLAGTWSYMSPEQVTAKRMGLDHRTDIFSLGVVLYELLTLRRPFEGDTTHQIAAQIITHEPPQASKIRSQCPRELAIICGKALEKAPARRYATMREFSADLHRHLANEPILARPTPRLVKSLKWAQRHPAKSTGMAGAVLLAVTLVSSQVVRARLYEDLKAKESARVQAELAAGEARSGEAEAVSLSRHEAYRKNIYAAAGAIDSGRIAEATEWLDGCPDELREWEWHHLKLKSDVSTTTLTREAPVKFMEWSPKGLEFVTVEGSRIYFWRDGESGGGVLLSEEPGWIGGISWDPSGKFLAIAQRTPGDAELGEVSVWSTDSRKEVMSMTLHAEIGGAPVWSPDGKSLAAIVGRDALWVLNAASGDVDQELVLDTRRQRGWVAWSHDGAFLGAVDGRGAAHLWDCKDWQHSAVGATSGFSSPRKLDWSPTGNLLAFRGSEDSVTILDVGKSESVELSGHEGVSSFEWSHDGNLLASVDAYGTIRVWHSYGALRGMSPNLAQSGGRLLAWSPDDSFIGVADDHNAIQLWNGFQGSNREVMRGHAGRIACMNWSPDGERIWSASDDKEIKFWEGYGVSAKNHLGTTVMGEGQASWADDWSRVASQESRGDLSLFDGSDGKEVFILNEPKEDFSLECYDLSHDGESLVLQRAGLATQLWTAQDGMSDKALFGQVEAVDQLLWESGGERVARLGNGGVPVEVRNISAAVSVKLSLPEGCWAAWCDWNPAGGLLAIVVFPDDSEVNELWIWDGLTPDANAVIRYPDRYISMIAWRPNGEALAVVTDDGTVRLWGVTTQMELSEQVVASPDRLANPGFGVYEAQPIAWAPDGCRIAIGAVDGAVMVVDLCFPDSTSELAPSWREVEDLEWNPSGTRLAIKDEDGFVQLWDGLSPGPLLVLRPNWSWGGSLNWSPDGSQLAMGSGVFHSGLDQAIRWGRAAGLKWRANLFVYDLYEGEGLSLEEDVLLAIDRNTSESAAVKSEACRWARMFGDLPSAEIRYHANRFLQEGRPWHDPERGLRLARVAEERLPEDPESKVVLAWALFANGAHQEAIAVMEQGVELGGEGNDIEPAAELVRLRERIAAAEEEDE